MKEQATKKVYAFDFDGTLTTRDTLIEFIRYAKGTTATIGGFLLYSPLLVLMKLGCYPNYKAKQRIFAHFFKGMSLDAFDSLCQSFAHSYAPRLLRPLGMKEIKKARQEKAYVVIVSASVDRWVRPFFTFLEPISDGGSAESVPVVLGTQIEVQDGLLTGRFLTPNCYGAEKVNRLKAVLSDERQSYYIVAYGDSHGDKELLAYADEGYFKPFR